MNETKTDKIDILIEQALSKKTNFCCYRYANENSVYFHESEQLLLNDCKKTPGFIIAPFDKNSQYPTLTIPFNFVKSDTYKYTKLDYNFTEIAKSEYIEKVSNLISRLKTTNGKVIISRVIKESINVDVTLVFKQLCAKYPEAFVFCYYTTISGLWIGASPEILLTNDLISLKTMALAGTRRRGNDQCWDLKNINEQKIVADYILTSLTKFGLNPQISKLYTKVAGPVEHLCNDVTAYLNDNTNVNDLIDCLSPTPAISGYPKNDAIETINKIESHNRAYYGGYIGPYSNRNKFNFYVNLRSMHIFKNNCYIIVGGGITKHSEAEKEWIETQMKAETLLSILRKC